MQAEPFQSFDCCGRVGSGAALTDRCPETEGKHHQIRSNQTLAQVNSRERSFSVNKAGERGHGEQVTTALTALNRKPQLMSKQTNPHL